MDNEADLYPCVGVCMADPDSGYCLGCGRPPLGSPEIADEAGPLASATPAEAAPTPTASPVPSTGAGTGAGA